VVPDTEIRAVPDARTGTAEQPVPDTASEPDIPLEIPGRFLGGYGRPPEGPASAPNISVPDIRIGARWRHIGQNQTPIFLGRS
jgi:hypothetical protein